jgi:hypothetical protein
VKAIILPCGKEALISDSDLEAVSKHKWHDNGNGYVRGFVNKKYVYLHRFITGATKGVDVDHINRNTLDNRRENLRLCSRSQNNANTGLRVNNKVGFRGVSFIKRLNRFAADIHIKKKHVFIGYFDSAIEAAKAYDAKALELFGEFAATNF